MVSTDARWPFRDRLLDLAWVLFALANLVAMATFPEWETVPFHFIWVSLTLVYGFRVWRIGGTAWVLTGVMGVTGLLLWRDVQSGSQPLDELTEVPLMAAMFVVMVWHARRRLVAMREVVRVSDDNRRLLEREKRFVQDASHQLRTPITIALGHAELMVREADAERRSSEDPRVVVDELQRLRRLADLLLRIVGAEEPRALRRVEVHADVLVADTVNRWMTVPRTWTVGELEAATVLADADQLQLALDELVQNAVTHTTTGDEISLAVNVSGGRVVIRVVDAGTGIHDRDLDRIFDRFAQSDANGQRAGRLGLGLSFVKSVAESHGGSVTVRSAVGRGSEFELSLLAMQPPEGPSSRTADLVAGA
jgi:signal transduction histidine kinase